MAETPPRDIEFTRDGVTLAGSIWVPSAAPPRATVVMHPGSGPSDRNNHGYFVPIRQAMVTAGYAVSAFDKRGVGRSTGRWQEAPIGTQASDLLSAIEILAGEEELAGSRFGVFGHSQGGWVVLDAAARSSVIEFVAVNSGPGVTPAAQERYSGRSRLELSGATPEEIEKALAGYDEMVDLARRSTPFPEVRARGDLSPYVAEDEPGWEFWLSILDYDPKNALSGIRAPILTLWGADDRIVPVEESIAVYRSMVPPTRLTVEVFATADHRVQVGEPPILAPGYVEVLLDFLDKHT